MSDPLDGLVQAIVDKGPVLDNGEFRKKIGENMQIAVSLSVKAQGKDFTEAEADRLEQATLEIQLDSAAWILTYGHLVEELLNHRRINAS